MGGGEHRKGTDRAPSRGAQGREQGQAPRQTVTGRGRRTEPHLGTRQNGTAQGPSPDRARPLPSPFPALRTRRVPHRRIPAPRLQLLLLLTAHGGVAPTYRAREPSAPSEPQSPRDRPALNDGHKMAAALPQGPLPPPNSQNTPRQQGWGAPT